MAEFSSQHPVTPHSARFHWRVLALYVLTLVLLGLNHAPRAAQWLEELAADHPDCALLASLAEAPGAVAKITGSALLGEYETTLISTLHPGTFLLGKRDIPMDEPPQAQSHDGQEQDSPPHSPLAGQNGTASEHSVGQNATAGDIPPPSAKEGASSVNGTVPSSALSPSGNGTLPATNGTARIAANGTRMTNGKTTVLIVGDSLMMEGLGPMLLRTLRKRPDLEVIREAKYSTGLSKKDYFDWPAHMAGVAAQHSPQLVIVCLGANDAQDITDDNKKRHPVGSDSWCEVYRQRAEAFAEAAQSTGAALVWVGLPVMGQETHAKNVLKLSAQQEAVCQMNGTRRVYVDTVATLADEKGNYAAFLKGSDGAPVRVRYNDKIHVNDAGGMMLVNQVLPVVNRLFPVPAPQAEETAASNTPPAVSSGTSTVASGLAAKNTAAKAIGASPASKTSGGAKPPLQGNGTLPVSAKANATSALPKANGTASVASKPSALAGIHANATKAPTPAKKYAPKAPKNIKNKTVSGASPPN